MKQSHSEETRPEDAPTTQRAVPLCFLLFPKSFESGRNLLDIGPCSAVTSRKARNRNSFYFAYLQTATPVTSVALMRFAHPERSYGTKLPGGVQLPILELTLP